VNPGGEQAPGGGCLETARSFPGHRRSVPASRTKASCELAQVCRGCCDRFGVGRGLEQCPRPRFGDGPGAGLDEGRHPVLPLVVSMACGCMEPGVDQLLDRAAAAEPARLAPGGQDVGAAADAELRRSRCRQPDAVPDADLVAGGQVNRDRLGDAAGCGAEAAFVEGSPASKTPWTENRMICVPSCSELAQSIDAHSRQRRPRNSAQQAL
jgi:hypothetical protein